LKLLKPDGLIYYNGRHLTFSYWTFDCEGKSANIDEMVQLIFNYVAKKYKALNFNKFVNVPVDNSKKISKAIQLLQEVLEDDC